jgi:hypothetical protein
MKKQNLILFLTVFATFLSLANFSVFAQIEVQRLEIEPLNRAVVYCSEIPEKIVSKLSDDKLKITLSLKNASVVDNAREFHGKGIIEDIYVQSFKKDLEISLILKDKRGYTILPLFYSKALAIEVFRWDKLDAGEDNYRSALLALEDGLNDAAKKYLGKSVQTAYSDAASVLGILQLQDGKILDALNNFHLAVQTGTNIPDIYAALAQISALKKNTAFAEKFKLKFLELSKVKTIPDMEISNFPAGDTSGAVFDSLLNSIYSKVFNTPVANKSSVNTDSLAKLKALTKDTDKKDKNDSGILMILRSFLPNNSGTIFTVFVVIFGILGIVLFYSYLRWRKLQTKKIGKKSSPQFKEDLKSAQDAENVSPKVPGNYAQSAYLKAGELAQKNQAPKKVKDIVPASIASSTITEKEKEENELTERLKSLIDNFESEQSIPTDLEDEAESENPDFEIAKPVKKAVTPRLELALHLQEEQKKVKERNIEILKTGDFPKDIQKISEVAKKLGIEKGSVETRNRLSLLTENKENLSKLAEKFDINIDNKDKT